jgi:mRNA-degrading endonuclease toxin of MazEF toxin-antitoxin module
MAATVQRGDVFYAPFGEGKPRPVVVVSRDDLNRGGSVVVVPFTTQKVDNRRSLPWCVFFPAGESGLAYDCVAKTDEIAHVTITDLDWRRGRTGRLLAPRMNEIVRAIRYTIRDADLQGPSSQSQALPNV